MPDRVLGHLLPNFIGLSFLLVGLCLVIVYQVVHLPGPIKVKSCDCGAHWWIRKCGFWRHLDASPFNDQLQNRWTIWMFEFRNVLVLSEKEQAEMGYFNGPVWDDGRPMWKRSKWQLRFKGESYCLRCTRKQLELDVS